jgi:anionic cell wall polymer biosynthesis LytR-Cps2A-Psr (LCP) family protein
MGWMAALVSGLLVVLLVALGATGIFLLAPSKPAAASFIRDQPGSIPWNGKDAVRVLFLGLDSSRSKSTGLAVASYDPSHAQIHVLTIPPSLWVTIPGFGQDRIENAYADGGSRLALLTVQSVTRTVIPYYVAVDPSTFQRLVDGYKGISVRTGSAKRQMSGRMALAYMAGGAAGRDGESERMQRDVRVASSVLRAAVRPVNLLQIASVINNLGGEVQTNFPYTRIPALLRHLAGTSIEASALDQSSGAVFQYRSTGGAVLLPYWQRIATIVRQVFPRRNLHQGRVEVLNGSGELGQASDLASWLRLLGFRVTSYGSADSFDYRHTEVVLNGGATSGRLALARALSAILQAPIVTRHVHHSRAPLVVIIGRDYQDLTQQ